VSPADDIIPLCSSRRFARGVYAPHQIAVITFACWRCSTHKLALADLATANRGSRSSTSKTCTLATRSKRFTLRCEVTRLLILVSVPALIDSFIKEISRVIPVIKVDYEKFRTPEVPSFPCSLRLLPRYVLTSLHCLDQDMAAGIAEQYAEMTNVRYVRFDGKPSGVESSTDRKDVSSPSASCLLALLAQVWRAHCYSWSINSGARDTACHTAQERRCAGWLCVCRGRLISCEATTSA
jgi:hypothetical protein